MIFLWLYLGAAILRCGDYWQSHCTGRQARYDRLHWKITFALCAGVLWLPLSLTKAVMIRLSVAVLLVTSPLYAKGMVVPAGTNKHYQNETFDAEGDSVAVKATSGVLQFTGCTFKNATAYLIDADGPVTLIVDGCRFDNTMHGVRFKGQARGSVSNSEFTGWLHYAVDIQGTKDFGPMVTVDSNYFHDPKPGSDSKGRAARQMVVAHNADQVVNIRGLRVINNRCYGPGEWHNPSDPQSRGTGDQIVLHYCEDFVVSNNVSVGGGENGISVTLDSRNGVVSGNIVRRNDGQGIQVGSKNEKDTPAAFDILVTGNICTDNGIRLDPNLTPDKWLVGIYCQDASRVSVVGNQVTDTGGKQHAGILIARCDDPNVEGNIIQGNKTGFVPVQVFADKPLKVRKHWGITGPAVIGSSADPIIEVVEDDVSIDRLTIGGRHKDDGQRQRGIFSDKAKRGRITDCSFAGMTNGVKLDGVDSWLIEDCEFSNIIGVKDGYGYGILCGAGGAHVIDRCRGTGSLGRGRHFVYLSAGTSGCVVRDSHATGFNSSTFAIYSKAEQPSCAGNVFTGCTARSQLTGADGSNGGAPEAAAFELTGKVSQTTLRDCVADKIAVNGCIVNTLGLADAEGVTLERFSAIGCKVGVFLAGAKRVRMLDSTIENGVAIHPWWRTAPKRSTEDVEINRSSAKVVINPTLPRPKRIVQDGKVLAP